jgi:hypothetical protein
VLPEIVPEPISKPTTFNPPFPVEVPKIVAKELFGRTTKSTVYPADDVPCQTPAATAFAEGVAVVPPLPLPPPPRVTVESGVRADSA